MRKLILCAIDGCQRGAWARGWCTTHYSRYQRHGDPLLGAKDERTTVERFWDNVDKDGPDGPLGPCWDWSGRERIKGRGYGGFTADGRDVLAHRFAYELVIGPIPEGLELDHLCRRPCCVNPAHMDPVPHAVNVLRGESLNARNARKTHCKHGHELAGENLMIRPGGGRKCRACHRAAAVRQRERQKAAA